jgi:flagellar motility protein MotE (MotC chaperone)
MAIRLLSVIVLIVLFAFTASAQQIFKWKDNKGQWHFSDTPPPGITAEKVKGLDISPKSSPATSVKGEGKEKSEARGSGEKALTPAKQLAEERERRQKRYKKRLEDIAQQIKTLNKRFDLVSKELLEAKGEGVISGDIAVSSPRMLRSWSSRNYPRLERKLSKLTKQMERLVDKREKLIREMRQKGFDTGYIPY